MDEWVIHLSSSADNDGFKEDIKFCHCDLPVLGLWILKTTLPECPGLLQHSLLWQLPADALPVDPFYHQRYWKPDYYCVKWRVLMSLEVMLKCMQPHCWGEGRAAALEKEAESHWVFKINASFLCLCVHWKFWCVLHATDVIVHVVAACFQLMSPLLFFLSQLSISFCPCLIYNFRPL